MHEFSLTPIDVPFVETNHRRIRTAIPSPETIPTIRECLRFEPLSMNDQLPVVWDRAKGYQVFDRSGNCWIDFTSTIFVANVGHSHPKVQKAIVAAAEHDLLNAYYYPTELRARLAKRLVEITPPELDCVLFLSTGSEGSEVTLKVMKMHGRRIRTSKSVVIGLENSFHGKTMGAQTLGGKAAGKSWIGHHHPNIRHLPYPYPWVLKEKKMTGEDFFRASLDDLARSGTNLEDVAGFVVEPYQGWCAVFLPQDYSRAMRKWATDHQVLVGIDEVQAGFGRTGRLFGYEHLGITPDIIYCAKAISASIPVSAVLAPRKVLDVDPSLNSTHGGNPIGMAASLASIDVIFEERLVEESERKGKLIFEALQKWRAERPDYVGEIFGAGMVWGIFIRNPKDGRLDVDLTDQLIERAMQKGLLSIRTGCGTLKLGPPLVTPDEALLEGIGVLRESLDEITGAS